MYVCKLTFVYHYRWEPWSKRNLTPKTQLITKHKNPSQSRVVGRSLPFSQIILRNKKSCTVNFCHYRLLLKKGFDGVIFFSRMVGQSHPRVKVSSDSLDQTLRCCTSPVILVGRGDTTFIPVLLTSRRTCRTYLVVVTERINTKTICDLPEWKEEITLLSSFFF